MVTDARARSFAARVAAVVSATEPGDLLTYGEVATEAGSPGAARAVGRALRDAAVGLPWWRVVGVGGQLARPVAREQARLLQQEGHVVDGAVIRGMKR